MIWPSGCAGHVGFQNHPVSTTVQRVTNACSTLITTVRSQQIVSVKITITTSTFLSHIHG
eukprot:m.240334 g.240334  ORF g.240334 m.240334 type:complete len:60 (+) comp15308_c0_seq1:206-385(+)